LRDFALAVRAEQQVHLLGAVEDVRPVLRRADVVWVPSRRDGGWNVALEAMALGRPVVAARLPGLAELVGEGETGALVAPGDKIGLARQTRLLLDDADRRRRCGEAGRERVRERFAVAGFVRRYLDLYAAVQPNALQQSG
jgi:glycosyltransferase involved in cell wall biosynthesis